MENFQLTQLNTISGIAATSGIVFLDDLLYLISDNSSFLYQYEISKNQLNKIKLHHDSEENTKKKEKLDFESITLFNNKLHLYGSGSTKKREIKFIYNLKSKEIKEKSLTKLYQKLKNFAQISDDDLNIEGTIITIENYYFFQRGNGENAKNGVFIYNRKSKLVGFKAIHLPKIQNVEATFTDAILIDDAIYFLAAAENSQSTYDDGEVLGSLIGSIDCISMKIDFTKKISDTHKFEGLTLYKKNDSEIEFLLCEDNDTEILESTIYKLTLNKK